MTSIMSDSRTPCSIAVEDTFGPIVDGSCLGGFDFTLLFEEAILTILPLGVACESPLPIKYSHRLLMLLVRCLGSGSNSGSTSAEIKGSVVMASASKNGTLFSVIFAFHCIGKDFTVPCPDHQA
jgi:hypothetical protein